MKVARWQEEESAPSPTPFLPAASSPSAGPLPPNHVLCPSKGQVLSPQWIISKARALAPKRLLITTPGELTGRYFRVY